MKKEELEQSFIEYFSKSHGLFRADSFAELGISSEVKHCKKGECIVQQGELAKNLFFFATGYARYVSISADGKEFTKSFACAPCIAGSTRAMVRQTPILFSIVALDDILYLEFEWQSFFEKMSRVPGFLETYIRILEDLFIGKEERESAFVHQSAEERYLNFLEMNPELKDKLPLQYIASYIGITPVALSRIRKKMGG